MQYGRRLRIALVAKTLRAVCRTSRKAVDDAVTAITVPSDAVQGTLPGHERFPACKQYTFVDPSEDIPRYVIHSCCRYLKGRTVLICGESGWRAPHIRDWIRMNQDELSEVSLILQLCEEHQEVDLSAYLQHILAIGPGVRLSLLGLWCEREGRIVLSTDVHWRHPLNGLQGIEELYAEFVHLDVAALQGFKALSHLHLVFDEWAVCNIQRLCAMETLHTLCLEADSVASLECHTLYELGPHICVLRLLGCAVSRSFVEVPDWKDFLFTLFDRLGNLECFETSQDARAWVRAASSESQQEEQQNVCDGLMVWRFWHLYVVVDRQSSALKGVLRDVSNLCLLQNASAD